jgi:hypothetical protein
MQYRDFSIQPAGFSLRFDLFSRMLLAVHRAIVFDRASLSIDYPEFTGGRSSLGNTMRAFGNAADLAMLEKQLSALIGAELIGAGPVTETPCVQKWVRIGKVSSSKITRKGAQGDNHVFLLIPSSSSRLTFPLYLTYRESDTPVGESAANHYGMGSFVPRFQ